MCVLICSGWRWSGGLVPEERLEDSGLSFTCLQASKEAIPKMSDKSEKAPLPPGWDMKFDSRTGK